MLSTHDRIISKIAEKYDNNWIVWKELFHNNYRFDLFAFNPKTKEVEITEVDVGNSTNQEKINYAKSLGKLKIITVDTHPIEPKKIQRILNALGNPIRIRILEILKNQGYIKYIDLVVAVKMQPTKDAGKFAYHLNFLLKTHLIKKDEKFYHITSKGLSILDFCKYLDEIP